MDSKHPLTDSFMLSQHKQLLFQSKEEFFHIRKANKRVKTSKIFSQQSQKQQFPQPLPKQSGDFLILKRLQNLDVKQLHYSLAQTQDPDALLQFKQKKPRKKMLPSKIYNLNQNKEKSFQNQINQSQEQNYFKKTKNQVGNFRVQQIHTPNPNTQIQINESVHYNDFNTKDLNQQHQHFKQKPFILRKITSLFENKVKISQEREITQLSTADFIILNQLGNGTYSKVYKAINKKTGFICALKVLEKKLMRQLKVQENAIRQIKILSCLHMHPNIATLYGSFCDNQNIYLILEYCTDGDLSKRTKANIETSKLTYWTDTNNQYNYNTKMNQTIDILYQACSALKQLHQNSIIHRDIKPQNILLTMGNSVKMSDFGWSVYNSKNQLRKTLCGTPLYLAPQFITTGQYNDAIDIWSLGVMAYQLFTNDFPFKIESVNDLIKIAKQQICFDKIKCEIAMDFCSKALVKDRHFRADIWELLDHKLFKVYNASE